MKEYVWYCPEWDLIQIAPKEWGFLFKDEIGEHHLCYILDKKEFDIICEPFEVKPFYLMGEF